MLRQQDSGAIQVRDAIGSAGSKDGGELAVLLKVKAVLHLDASYCFFYFLCIFYIAF